MTRKQSRHSPGGIPRRGETRPLRPVLHPPGGAVALCCPGLCRAGRRVRGRRDVRRAGAGGLVVLHARHIQVAEVVVAAADNGVVARAEDLIEHLDEAGVRSLNRRDAGRLARWTSDVILQDAEDLALADAQSPVSGSANSEACCSGGDLLVTE